MGSGVEPLAIATRSSKRGVQESQVRNQGSEETHRYPDTYNLMSVDYARRLPLRVKRVAVTPCNVTGWIKPIERLVPVSFTHYCASTPGLSTWWSTTALKRDLVSRRVSRLDAFSGYPFRT